MGLSAGCDVAIAKNFVFLHYADGVFLKYSFQIEQNMGKETKKPFFKTFRSSFQVILEDQKQKSDAPFVTASSVQASKLRKPEVAQLEVKFDLFSSIGLGGAQQLLCISQWKLFFIHSA